MKMYNMIAIAKCNIIMKNGFMVRCNMPYQGLIDEDELNRLKEYFIIKSTKEILEDNSKEKIDTIITSKDEGNHNYTNHIEPSDNEKPKAESSTQKRRKYVKKVKVKESE